MQEPIITRAKNELTFKIVNEWSIVGVKDPKWTPQISDYNIDVLKPDSLVVLNKTDGLFGQHSIREALNCGYVMSSLPNLKFENGSPLMKALLQRGQYKVKAYNREWVIYTHSKFKQVLEREGKRSVNALTRKLKGKLKTIIENRKLSAELISEFSK